MEVKSIIKYMKEYYCTCIQSVLQEELKGEITTVVGAVLGKQQCWERSACTLGKRTRSFAAKDLLFM